MARTVIRAHLACLRSVGMGISGAVFLATLGFGPSAFADTRNGAPSGQIQAPALKQADPGVQPVTLPDDLRPIAIAAPGVSLGERLRLARAARQAAEGSARPVQFLGGVAPTPLRQRWAMPLATRLNVLEARIAAEQLAHFRCMAGQCTLSQHHIWKGWVDTIKSAEDPIRAVQQIVHRQIAYHHDRRGHDRWQTPFQTLARGAGDCEDHAVLKRALLLDAGIAPERIDLVFMVTGRGQGHVVVTVDTDAGTRLLDNRTQAQRVGRLLPGDRVVYVHKTDDPRAFTEFAELRGTQS